jgi:DNA modification methylase
VKPYYERGDIRIYHGDSREVAPQLEPVDLVVTSPPYADQRRYGFKKGEFRWDHVVPRALAGVSLKPDGQMLVNLGLVHKDGEVVCYWEPMIHTLRSFGYRLFGWYSWDQSFGLPGDWHGRFAPSHEWVFHFNRAARQPNKSVACKRAGKNTCGSVSDNRPDGSKNIARPRDLWVVQDTKIPDSTIRVCREQARNVGGHPAPYPVALADFMLKAWDGTVLDPFMGGGTTLVAAYRLNRPAIGIEIDESYCEIAAKRLNAEALPLEAAV